MAWARDSATGEPRYILELGADRRGAKCGCECVSCGLPLTAVNAAKTDFIKRPHFRHPEGAERDDCLILAGRAAVLRQLRDDGWIDLPRRRMSARVVGLSGQYYEAWVEHPPERVHISSFHFQDSVTAILSLDDGRVFRALLTGTAGDVAAGDGTLPSILLDVDDPAIASMDPAEIRKRLTLLPTMRWCAHWDDLDMQKAAELEARTEAERYLDEVPDWMDVPLDLDPALRRETVLHLEVKRILAESKQIIVPGMEAVFEVSAPGGRTLNARWSLPAQQVNLADVRLEQRFGRIIPDLICEVAAEAAVFSPLLIEVTVTNQIDDERLSRIRAMNAPTLEIDLSLSGGRVTRDELRRFVVDELATKRWLHLPEADRQKAVVRADLEGAARLEWDQIERVERRKREALAMPLADVVMQYRQAAIIYLKAQADADGDWASEWMQDLARNLRREFDVAAEKMELHGYPEANHVKLIGHHEILSRLFSIQMDRGIGYRLKTGWDVMNSLWQSKGAERSNATLFLLAERVYKPILSKSQRESVQLWREEVRESLSRDEFTFVRHPIYDRILSVLFPEMARGLAVNGKHKAPLAELRELTNPIPPADTAGLFTPDEAHVSAGWLSGRELRAWKMANPQSAAAWAAVRPDRRRLKE